MLVLRSPDEHWVAGGVAWTAIRASLLRASWRTFAAAAAEVAASARARADLAPGGVLVSLGTVAVKLARPMAQDERRARPQVLPVDEVLARALRCSSSAVSLVDTRAPGHPVIFVNAAFERLTGYTAADAVGSSWTLVEGPDTDPDTARSLRDGIEQKREIRVRVRHHRRDGSAYWSEAFFGPVRDDAGAVTHYLAVQKDVTEAVEAERRSRHHAHHDALTGLPNRRHLERRLAQELTRTRTDAGTVALLFLDLDGFKPVNDQFGHHVGDEVLRVVAARWQAVTRRQDLLARYGGDEFAVVLTDLDPAQATDLAQTAAGRFTAALREPLQVAQRSVEVRVGVSVGVAICPGSGATSQELLMAADASMYRAKTGRRGRT